jgi:hypothetical protein
MAHTYLTDARVVGNFVTNVEHGGRRVPVYSSRKTQSLLFNRSLRFRDGFKIIQLPRVLLRPILYGQIVQLTRSIRFSIGSKIIQFLRLFLAPNPYGHLVQLTRLLLDSIEIGRYGGSVGKLRRHDEATWFYNLEGSPREMDLELCETLYLSLSQ